MRVQFVDDFAAARDGILGMTLGEGYGPCGREGGAGVAQCYGGGRGGRVGRKWGE